MSLTLAAAGVATFSSCEDMLDKGNSYVIYADTEHLTSSSDTVTSVVGILNKLQAIAVRTNLLGEVRADLVNVKENAIVDLKNLALFNADVTGIDDENQYNAPRDYYAVINNCNYFLDRVNDSLPEIHTDAMEYMFEREIAAVHTMRAWTYLQCVLAYGKIPFVTTPVLSEADSKKQYPLYGIDEICDYFIQDLIPYVNVELPDYNKFDNDKVVVKTCFFPTNLVLADLYLWKAASNHDPEMAKMAAKSYYDFIEWDLSGKERTVTNTSRVRWSDQQVYEEKPLRSPSGSFRFSTTGTWGAQSNECITAIPMDSSSAKGFSNELKQFYNSQRSPEVKEASIEPSEAYKTLSRGQSYLSYYRDKDVMKEVTVENLEDEAVLYFMDGDLRFSSFWSTSDYEYNEKELKMQTISKHQDLNIEIYRIQQVYLRLAEALNYAGYPRFAKKILTTGLSRSVIEAEVQPYYTSSADSTFLNYFEFNDRYYMPYVERYSPVYDQFRDTIDWKYSLRNDETEANMMGIHTRGAGYSFMNENYLPVLPVDSAYYPFPENELNAVPEEPVLRDYTSTFPAAPKLGAKKVDEPSSWAEYPGETVSKEVYVALPALQGEKESRRETLYDRYIKNDSVGLYAKYLEALDVYNAELAVYSADTAAIMDGYRAKVAEHKSAVKAYFAEWTNWHKAIYANPTYVSAEQEQVDQAILDEQALELVYEGNRYYDLMRRALWYGDVKRLNDPISEARPEVAGKLLDKKNWFLHYKGQIGY